MITTSTIQATGLSPGNRSATTVEMGVRTRTINTEAVKIIGRMTSLGNGPMVGMIQKLGAEFAMPVKAISKATRKTP